MTMPDVMPQHDAQHYRDELAAANEAEIRDLHARIALMRNKLYTLAEICAWSGLEATEKMVAEILDIAEGGQAIMTRAGQDIIAARKRRVTKANKLLLIIASNGRRFFRSGSFVAAFSVDERGRVWFHDDHSRRKLYTHRWPPRRGFCHGGTMASLVRELRDWIMHGKQVRCKTFGPWPDWVCGGDLWGYGDDMDIVRNYARQVGIVEDGDGRSKEKQQ